MYQPIYETDHLDTTRDRLVVVESVGDEAAYEARPISDFWLVVASALAIATLAVVLYEIVSPLANL